MVGNNRGKRTTKALIRRISSRRTEVRDFRS